ncbi:MAG: alpha/beta fold hydrolase [Labedaea sp.]
MPVSVAYTTTGLVLVEHEFQLPLDHSRPDGEKITVFAREVADPDGRDRPFLLFLQGGPGHEAARPIGSPRSPGWLDRALRDYRVLMLDQRGTGRSTPVDELAGRTPQEQADYLAHFRADAIVRDAELIRDELGHQPWSVLGQSFGGFCAFTYLSHAPQGLREVFITGGVPPVGRHIDEVYRATYARTIARVQRYYRRYPADRDRVRELYELLETKDVRLPDGDRLTGRRLRQLGSMLGMSYGADQLHYLLELPVDSAAFRYDLLEAQAFARNPLYTLLHEPCYGDGNNTRWSAQRTLPRDYERDVTLLTGEHSYPWMFEDYGGLAPLKDAAGLLAARTWPRLYDPERLRNNEVPVAAAVYAEDLYVEAEFSMRAAAGVRNMRCWLTNEYDHNGLRADGSRILSRLIDLTTGRA